MDALLVAAIKAGKTIVHLVTVTLPGYTIRWTDGSYVPWGANVYRAIDDTYGALNEISDIVDGVDNDSSPVSISILAPSLTSIAGLSAADAQGGLVTIHIGATGDDGQLIGAPYQLYVGELDRPVLQNGEQRTLDYDIIAAYARGLEENNEQRMTDSFHQSVWPGELGYQYQTDGTKKVFWREDDPNLAISFIRPRKRKDAHPTEFNYDPDAPWPFPIGRVGIAGTPNYRIGYGPTNRYQSIFFTVAASGPIKSWVSFAASDEVTTFDGTLHKATDGEHVGFMWLRRFNGTQPQAALTSPTGTGAGPAADGWTTDHKQSGKAVACWTGFENSKKNEFGGGIPTFLNVIEGLYGYDPRASGCTLTVPSTWVYIEDGATWGLNWCIGRWEGASAGGLYGVPYACSLVGGIAAPLYGIDTAAFVSAANNADARGWKVSGVPWSNDNKDDVLKDMLAAAGARPARRCGMLSCVSDAAVQTSVLTATENDTVGTVEVAVQPSRMDRRNSGIGSFPSEAHRWEQTSILPVTNSAWVTADGGKRSTDISFKYVPNKDQCAALTYLALADAREATGSAKFKPYMLQLEPGNCFDWNAPELLMTGVKAKVEKRTYSPSSCELKIDWRTETDTKFAEAYAKTGVTPADSAAPTVPPAFVEAPTDLSASVASGTITILYRNPNNSTFDFVNLYRSTDSTSFGAATIVDFYGGGAGEFVSKTQTPTTGHTYRYWVVAVDIYGNTSAAVGPTTGITV